VLQHLEREAALWREEPMKRVAFRAQFVRPLRQRQFHAFGPKSIVQRPQWLYGPHKIAVGYGVVLLENCWLAVERIAWDKPGPVLELRDGVGARPGCTLSAAESMLLEEHVGMGANVTVIDSRHTWSAGHTSPIYSPVETAPVRVGKGTWLADRASVTAGSDIGEQCAIGPNTVVSGTIPDYSIVLGNPGRVVGKTR
jgi:acetyltransferase-like isoleucine patch superfamily enzyme